jgi:CBS domain-containing protein/anti-sigma regulatory factor (Ser/Thr protein kinase)
MLDNLNPQSGVITDRIARDITRVEELAYDLKIEQVMTKNVRTVSPDMSMEEVLDIFRDSRISGSPVVADEELVGIISIEDLIRALRIADLRSPVSKYMTGKILHVDGRDPVVEALKKFTQCHVGRLPVLDENGKLAGIITKGDITRGILKALQSAFHEEEIRRYRVSHLFDDIISDRTSLILRYHIKKGDFTHGGTASSYIKRALVRMGANPQLARRCGIAIYEAEMNLIIHTTDGGTIRVEIEPHQISMDAYDNGPGIPNIELARKPGYSTASEAVRELGFGAGMGLVNIERCVDEMNLESVVGQGTRLRMRIFLNKEEAIGESYPQYKETDSNDHSRNHQ